MLVASILMQNILAKLIVILWTASIAASEIICRHKMEYTGGIQVMIRTFTYTHWDSDTCCEGSCAEALRAYASYCKLHL